MNCPLCGSEKVESFKKGKQRQLARCPTCNVVFVRDDGERRRDVISEYGHKFAEEYLEHEGLFAEYFNQIWTTVEAHKACGNLLDVGCGIGTFLKRASAKGWRTLGIDLSLPATLHARQCGLHVENASLEDLGGQVERFDVVTLFQTIEHMEDPMATLAAARRMLKKDGMLVVTTPNRASLLGRILGKKWFGYHNDEHLFFFDKMSFEFMLKKAGFRIISLKVDSGKPLTLSWVLTRVADYYYRHRPVVYRSINPIKALSKRCNWIRVKEPMVDLIAITQVQ